MPSVHDYESFLLIRFIEPLHQTGATFSPSLSLCLSLYLRLSFFALILLLALVGVGNVTRGYLQTCLASILRENGFEEKRGTRRGIFRGIRMNKAIFQRGLGAWRGVAGPSISYTDISRL